MARPVEWKPRGVVGTHTVRHQSPVSRFLPEGPLEPLVEHFWTMAWDLRDQATVIGETLPHPSVYLVVEAGRSGLAGVNTHRFLRRLEGRGRVYGIKFHPGAFRPFWHGSVHSLTDRVVPLGEAFGPEGEALEAAVLACGEEETSAIALLEDFLLGRLPAPDARAQLARRLVAQVLEDRALTQAETLARSAGLSLRSLQRLFKDCIGVSPKWVIQRYRLHDAMDCLEHDRSIDFPALALRLGFCDQAHFIRVFKTFLGRTPTEYARLREG